MRCFFFKRRQRAFFLRAALRRSATITSAPVEPCLFFLFCFSLATRLLPLFLVAMPPSEDEYR